LSRGKTKGGFGNGRTRRRNNRENSREKTESTTDEHGPRAKLPHTYRRRSRDAEKRDTVLSLRNSQVAKKKGKKRLGTTRFEKRQDANSGSEGLENRGSGCLIPSEKTGWRYRSAERGAYSKRGRLFIASGETFTPRVLFENEPTEVGEGVTAEGSQKSSLKMTTGWKEKNLGFLSRAVN